VETILNCRWKNIESCVRTGY